MPKKSFSCGLDMLEQSSLCSIFSCKKNIRLLPCSSSFAKSRAWFTCSVVNALATVHLAANFLRAWAFNSRLRNAGNIFFIGSSQKKHALGHTSWTKGASSCIRSLAELVCLRYAIPLRAMINAYGIWRKGYYIILLWSGIYNTAKPYIISCRRHIIICLPIKTVLYQMFGSILLWNPLWNFALLKGSISVYKEIAGRFFRRRLPFACFSNEVNPCGICEICLRHEK